MNVTGSQTLRLTWHNLAKHYGARPVWQHLEGELSHGEVLVVSGPNGAGKSTLLRLLCGLETADAGSIIYEWRGQRWTPTQMRPFIGVVAPDIAVYRELTALENVHFFATARGQSVSSEQLHTQLAQVGLLERAHDQVAAFSSGMVLRLKYAVALIQQPTVLLLDEPTAMFDAAGRTLVEHIITAQRQRGITVIATNDARELAWGDLLLKAGSA